MPQVTVEATNIKAVDDFLVEYPRRAASAIVRALNRTLTTGNAEMARLIAADMKMKVGDVKKAVRQKKASVGDASVTLAAPLKRLPLYLFGAKGPRPSRGRGAGVVSKLQGRMPHAFIARMPSGHEGVFERKGMSRLPIKELYGPSIGHVFGKFRPQVAESMAAVFAKNIDHEISFAQSRDRG